jgi:pimeloyl-ACP methyl ester carboxylesterase
MIPVMADTPEQSRARYPDDTGFIERDGVRVFWESYGTGEQTLLLLPTWMFAHSRVWKAQIPYLARHFRVVTFDPRGNGRSDRPAEASAYDETQYAQDALDVMDACGVERAVCVALSWGAQRALLLATESPERVSGVVFIGPLFPVTARSLLTRVAMHPLSKRLSTRPPLTTRGLASSIRTTGPTGATPTSSTGGRGGCCPTPTRPSRSRTRWPGPTTPTVRRSR